jgi:hypothetical protein
MPVDLEILHPFIQAMIAVQNNKERQFQFDKRQKLDEDEFKAREARAKELLAQRKEEFELEKKAREFTQKLQLSEFKSKLENEYLTGKKKLDRAPNVVPGTPEHVINDSALRYITKNTEFGPVQLEGVRDFVDVEADKRAAFQAQTPLVADRAGQVAGAEIDAQMPKIEAQFAQQIGLQNMRNEQALILEAARLEKAKELEGLRHKNNVARDSVNNASRRSIAEMRLKGQAVDPNAVELSMHRILTGDDTVESLAKQLPIGKRKSFTDAAQASGIKVLRDQDIKDLAGLQMLQQVYEKYSELAVEANKPVPWPGKLMNLKAEADTLLGQLAKSHGGDKGALSNQDVQRAKGNEPSWRADLFESGANERKLKNIKNVIDTVTKRVTFDMKPEQAKILLEKFSINTATATPENSSKVKVTRDPVTGKLK